jgi:membrane-associated phospholipid phosphatase
VLAACAVAVALVGLGHHYFTDTVGGAAVGTAVVLATALVLDRLAPEAPRDRARLPDV